MNIPNYENTQFTDRAGNLTDPWSLIMQQLISALQTNLSDYGYIIPSVTSAPNSAIPPATGTLRNQVQASFGLENGVVAGTLIFDPYELNGGSVGPPRSPNGQLFIMLNDGVFHPITNT